MNCFLKQLANYYLGKYNSSINELCFVFPSKRAGLFFKEYLKQLTDKAIWAPKIFSINDFIEELSTCTIADKLTLNFELYKAYENVFTSGISFDDFYPWGEIIQKDFDDIDKYQADAQQLYANLLAIKNIEDDYSFLSDEQIKTIKQFWESFNAHKISEHQDSFVRIWEKLGEVYSVFNKQLDDKNIAYEGKAYKVIADKINAKQPLDIKYKRIVFVGFNALTRCEEKLFNHLKIVDKADFIWDYIPWLNPIEISKIPKRLQAKHEALKYIEDNILNYPQPSDFKLEYNTQLPDITVTAVASDTAQTMVAHSFVNNVYSNEDKTTTAQQNDINNATKCAVILADEGLLLPALHSLPNNVGDINISMGYPIKKSPAYGLIEVLCALQSTCRTSKNGNIWFYHKNVLAVLNHQYIKHSNTEDCTILINQINKQNSSHIEARQLHQNDFLKSLFTHTVEIDDFNSYINKILTHIIKDSDKRSDKLNTLENEFLYQTLLLVNHLSDLINKLGISINLSTWIKLLKRSASTHSAPFSGEPLKGLQLIGMLETRTLDFENLIIISGNEGNMPPSSSNNSLIPYSLRYAFSLPTNVDQDALYAYYFYRLLNRSKNVQISYNTDSRGSQNSEMSRFLYQLKYEYKGNIRFNTLSEKVNISKVPELDATKDSHAIQKLEQYLVLDKNVSNQKTLSPSALSTYIECSLRFYYKYILETYESDEVSEDVDYRIFGNIFHETMEMLYSDFVGKEVTSDDIDLIIKDKNKINDTLEFAFSKSIGVKGSKHEFIDIMGQQTLIFDIIKQYTLKFLEFDKQSAPFTILGLEAKVKYEHELSDGRKILIGGTIDRLDLKDNVIRVIDYKTGSGESNIAATNLLFDQNIHSKSKAIFQTLLYCNALHYGKDLDKRYSSYTMQPGVVWLKKIFKSKELKLSINKQEIFFNHFITEFNENLNQLLNEIYNINCKFEQSNNKGICQKCSYKNVCSR